MWVDVKNIEMQGVEKEYSLGVITDEDAMFDLLAKFLNKEGYRVKRILQDIGGNEDFNLVIYAPSRFTVRSKEIFRNITREKLLILQSVDEDLSSPDDGAVVLSERPLNLKQLSDTIRKTLAESKLVRTVR